MFPAERSGYLDLHNFRNREWKPAQIAAGVEPRALEFAPVAHLLGDLGAALLADPGFRVLVAVAVDGVGAGVGRCFDERPAEIARALFAEWPTQVALTGLVDAWAERPL